MEKTRLSLIYPASYLLFIGAFLMLSPDVWLRLAFSNGNYGDVMPRAAGSLLFGLGIVVAQIVRKRVESLYATTLFVRGFFLMAFTALYFYSQDPYFVSSIVVVAIGLLLTGYSFMARSRSSTRRLPSFNSPR